ncbi:hypothetical protein LEP1GSC133_0120 [Leptospira borgpetersenii serovar Pomona str. 200901868]|uniref:Uncharacterized protein n=1 Tax=Leptospira borgpetersenii serovar Pomona str. 200901868 TaxID=1192866 RepID=M6WEK3_LEPBO|nr:hypothetical protein LEP1GSC133_0120 [Leptospira borgpetersenii serovar Pomona str. 200901868]
MGHPSSSRLLLHAFPIAFSFCALASVCKLRREVVLFQSDSIEVCLEIGKMQT